jgi:LPS O-antigen subunit length determinant protein (WzzB/FepE family)
MNQNKASNDIDLVEIFTTLWSNRIKVVLIVALTVAVVLNYQINKANEAITNYKFSTKISAVSIFEEIEYQAFNNSRKFEKTKLSNNNESENQKITDGSENETTIKKIDRYFLFDIFVVILKEEREKLVKEFDFIKREDYEDKLAYQTMIDEIVSSINIIKIKENKSNRGRSIEGIIEFETQDINIKNKWVKFVNTLEDNINKSVQRYLKKFLNTGIESIKLDKRNKIEAIEVEIENSIKSYELEMNSRLSYLNEQAKIAREGNIPGENVNPASFGSNYSINYSEDSPLSLYYLKGYRVIEKEIELIKNRNDPYLFVKEIPDLELKKLKIQSDKFVNEVEDIIKKTPIFNDDKFIAGRILKITKSEQNTNEYLSVPNSIIYAVLIGFIIAIFYVYISKALYNSFKRNHK